MPIVKVSRRRKRTCDRHLHYLAPYDKGGLRFYHTGNLDSHSMNIKASQIWTHK